MNVVDALAECAAIHPDRMALAQGCAGDESVSFRELVQRSGLVSDILMRHDIRRGDRVLIFHPPTIDLYVALIAIFRLGAVAMVVEASGGSALLSAACRVAPPRALLASPRGHMARLFHRTLRVIPIKLTTGWTALPSVRLDARGSTASHGIPVCDVAPDDAALITFTSGSTGTPKAAVRTHALLQAQRDALADITAQAGEIELCTLPIVVLANLANGASTVLPDADLRTPSQVDGGRLTTQVMTQHCTRVTAPPAVLDRIVTAAAQTPGQLNGLRTIVTGGGPVFPRHIDAAKRVAPGARVIAVYGSTEAEPIAHVNDEEIGTEERRMMRDGAGLLAGTVCTAATVRILSWTTTAEAHHDQPHSHANPNADCSANMADGAAAQLSTDAFDAATLGAGEVGEIVVSGAHVVAGYLGGVGDAETKIRVADRIWHRTGDLGRIDERGRLWLLGRVSEAVRDSRGVMYPFAVECALRERVDMDEVAAISVDGCRTLIVSGDAAILSDSALTGAVPWAGIERVIRVKAIPMDRRHNSKVDYGELRRVIARM